MRITLGSGHQDFLLTRDGSRTTISDFKSTYFSMSFSGADEVPPNGSLATGTGTAVLNFDQTRFSFATDTSGIDLDGNQTVADAGDNLVGMHIHNAPAGTSGGILFDILGSAATDRNAPQGTVAGLWTKATGLTPANVQNLLTDNTYINLHTGDFPGGEIRGQIVKQDDGLDRIDLTGVHIGSFATLKEITQTTSGSAVIATFLDGAATRLRLLGVSERELSASDFIFDGAAPLSETGTSGRDDLFGARGDDHLSGRAGNDRLFGDRGDDMLVGAGGADQLFGGKGLDVMRGGGGGDSFIFRTLKDSGATIAGADFIHDFTHGTDRIDLSAIDADTSTAGNQAFTSLVGNFTAEGQIRVTDNGVNTIVAINTAGAGGAEMMLRFSGVIAFDAGDFVL